MPIYTDEEKYQAYARACEEVEVLNNAKSLDALEQFKWYAQGYAQCLMDENVLTESQFTSLHNSLENVVAARRKYLERQQ